MSHRLYNDKRLSLYDDLLAEGAFLGGDNEEIDAIGIDFHIVRATEAAATVVGLETVDEQAPHVIYLHFGFAVKVFEEELHLTVVRIGNHIEVNRARRNVVFINTIWGATA